MPAVARAGSRFVRAFFLVVAIAIGCSGAMLGVQWAFAQGTDEYIACFPDGYYCPSNCTQSGGGWACDFVMVEAECPGQDDDCGYWIDEYGNPTTNDCGTAPDC